MRALVCRHYGSPDDLVVEEVDDPVASADDIVVDIQAAGLNFPDVLVISGEYQTKAPLPFIPGHEAAGIVSSVGDRVSRFSPGDRVIITPTGGAFAEKCAVEQNLAMPMPESLDFGQAAGFTITYSTSFHALRQSADLQPGETVLVLGAAGGVGITAVEIARAMGARVIAAASSDEKLGFARSAGADELVNYSDVSLKDTVKKLTDGKGVDVVYDPVGGDMAEQALRTLAWHGRYLVIGFASGRIPNFPANVALLKEASIVGVWWGTWAAKHPQEQHRNLQAMEKLLAEQKLKPRVMDSYALDDFAKAFRAITERRVQGKVVFMM